MESLVINVSPLLLPAVLFLFLPHTHYICEPQREPLVLTELPMGV